MTLIGSTWVTPASTWSSPFPGGEPGQVQMWYLRLTQPDGREVFVVAEVRVLAAFVRHTDREAAAGR